MKTFRTPLLLLVTAALTMLAIACLKELKPTTPSETTQFTLTAQKPPNTELLNFDEFDFSILTANLTNRRNGLVYTSRFNADGTVKIDLEPGLYAVLITGQFPFPHDPEDTVYINASVDDFLLNIEGIVRGDGSIEPVKRSVRLNAVGGEPDIPLVIREVYYGGGPHIIEGRTLATDQYVEIYNNGTKDVIIDSLFVGTAMPFNSTVSENGWWGRDTFAVAYNQFMIPPRADRQPRILRPGESIVIAMANAIDFRGITQAGLRLDRVHFAAWHPVFTSREIAPGVPRMLRVTETGHQGTGGFFSVNSPAVIIYKIPNLPQYLNNPGVWQGTDPRSTSDRLSQLICASWVIDGVEVFANPTDRTKRLPHSIDASFTYLKEGRLLGNAVRRKVQRIRPDGTVKYMDTNNSAVDFETDVKPNPRLRTD